MWSCEAFFCTVHKVCLPRGLQPGILSLGAVTHACLYKCLSLGTVLQPQVALPILAANPINLNTPQPQPGNATLDTLILHASGSSCCRGTSSPDLARLAVLNHSHGLQHEWLAAAGTLASYWNQGHHPLHCRRSSQAGLHQVGPHQAGSQSLLDA